MVLAVISGTGMYDLAPFRGAEQQVIATPWGEAVVYEGCLGGEACYFLPRHGREHKLPPHLINYRANAAALAYLGVRAAFSVCCVGGIREEWAPGTMAVLDQFIDMTSGRESSFSAAGAVVHTDMSAPYCPVASAALLRAAKHLQLPVEEKACYICTQGPRFETPAEIRAFSNWGADVVGMTGVPEAPLLREAGICLTSLAVIANYAAGVKSGLVAEDIDGVMAEAQADIERLLPVWAYELPPDNCSCRKALAKPLQNWLNKTN